MSKLAIEMVKLARNAGGSFQTVSNRSAIINRFAEHLLQQNIQTKKVSDLKLRHIEGYINLRLAQKIALRTLQNEMAAIRAVLLEAGRTQLVQSERLNNKSLGLSGASRDGTKTAISPERYKEAMLKALEIDRGVAACLQLSYTLGLRSEEAVQSCKSLNTWNKALKNGAPQLPVTYGTKGGRPREVTFFDHDAVCDAIGTALTVAKEHGGNLINRPDLKSAMNRFHNVARSIGLKGKEAPHSLRYSFSQRRIAAYIKQGLSEDEALARTSCDLGHGDGRGVYIKQVYSK